jgi:hypothetical protein
LLAPGQQEVNMPPNGMSQIRGPGLQPDGLVGPQVIIVGQGVDPAGGFLSQDVFTAGFDAVAGQTPNAVAILMVDTSQDKQQLVQQWGPNQSSPGFLVGRQTTRAQLDAAIQAAGAGPLRVLIAGDVATRNFLSNVWDNL